MDSKNLLSYNNILADIKSFKRAGTSFGDDFNKFDTPSHKYFKILFYFGSAPEMFETDSASGLLAPTWEQFEYNNTTNKTDYYNYNSAWAFLKMNNEEERAEKLKKFITLLSDISSYSPWYFNTISGLGEAIERKVADDGKLDLSENKHLTINCLPDAFDNRISSLLELYRDVVWSWVQKKEIIPANLRKFDMAIYIFETPNHTWHTTNDIIGSENNSFGVSYKMLEFHDCEFGYNSIKSGFNELNNSEGFNPKYTIDISYRDCYEISYNDIMMRTIGDIILTDLLNSYNEDYYISKAQEDKAATKTELLNREMGTTEYKPEYIIKRADNTITYFGNLSNRTGKATENINEFQKVEYKPGFLMNAVGQVAGHLVSDIKGIAKRAILGNIHTYSLTQIGTQISEAAKGNLIKTGMTVAQYLKNNKNRNSTVQKPNGNIFNKSTLANNI